MVSAKELPELKIFDELIADAENALVKQAIGSGRIPVGYNCYVAPLPLMMLGNLFPVRMRAVGITDTPNANYYMTHLSCTCTRANLEEIINGTYNFIRAFISGGACMQMGRVAQHAKYVSPFKEKMEKGELLVHVMDSPRLLAEAPVECYLDDIKGAARKLSDALGVPCTDEALRTAIVDLNRHNALLKRVSDFRKEKEPKITGTEFHKVMLASLTSPKDLLEKPLEKLIAALAKRDPVTGYKAKVMIVGPVLDDAQYSSIIEEQGALVVADRYCFGSLPGMEPIPEEGDPWANMAQYYAETCECARMMGGFNKRLEEKNKYIKEFGVDGVIVHIIKFCDLWAYEVPMSLDALAEQGIPSVRIEHDYTFSNTGQIKTRVQAFLEQIENSALMR
jgi:benzoyl-CoA reductase/2-hydroxyglutaryl-CoA dehydratase subunit BcrC/BadD/HgdB